jgi:TolA-binding protein
MQTLDNSKIKQAVAGILFLTLITGCAEWNSHPVVVQQNFGNAVNNMVKNQTLYPEHGQNDEPILGLDGQKSQTIIRAYRESASEKLDKAKQGPSFDVRNVGGSNN